MMRGESIEETRRAVDSHEFSMWTVYFSKEPVWWERLELMLAQVTAAVYNSAMTKGGRRAKPTDFIPNYWGDIRTQSEDDIIAAKNAALAHMKRNRPQMIKGNQ